MSKKPVYEAKIVPLVNDLMKLCDQYGIAGVMAFEISAADAVGDDIEYAIACGGNEENFIPDILERAYDQILEDVEDEQDEEDEEDEDEDSLVLTLSIVTALLKAAHAAALDPNPKNPSAATKNIDRALALIEALISVEGGDDDL